MRAVLPAALFLCFCATLQAQPRHYALDPVHSRIVFFVKHAGFSRAIGTFSGISGSLLFDPDDPGSAKVEASIPIGSLDLGDTKWRDKVLDPTFFNVKKYPQARFVSSGVDVADDASLRVRGTLELHGRSRETVLTVRLNQIKRHPLTLRSTAGFSASASLSRAEFGMSKWKNLVGDEVEVLIEIEATRERDPEEKD